MIKPLTSFRFIFAFMVFLHHLGFLKNSENTTISNFYNNFLFEGFIGVSFFFILSGFILSYVYINKIPNKSISLKRFFVFRFARIYPLHIITLLIALPLTYKVFINSPVDWGIKLVEQLTLTQGFVPVYDHYFSFNIVSWSISNEFFFYALFPFILIWSVKLDTKKLLVYFSIISFCILLLMHFTPKSIHHAAFYINPAARLFDFILGIILYRITQYDLKSIKKHASIFELVSIIVLVVFYLNSHNIPIVYRFSIYYWIPMCFIILVFSFQKGIISRVLSNKIFVSLGEVSYGFYLIHFIIIQYSLSVNKRFNITENDIVFALIILSCTLVASYASYYIFEKPSNKFIKKLLLRNK